MSDAPLPPTPQDVLAYVQAPDSELAFATAKTTEATSLVNAYLGLTGLTRIPPVVYSEAIKEVASKLWGRRGASDMTAISGEMEAPPIMPAKDPLVTVYAILGRYAGGGFA